MKKRVLSIVPDAGSVSDWAKDAMADAVGLGLISGASNGGQTLLEPQGSATREQVATILMVVCKNIKKGTDRIESTSDSSGIRGGCCCFNLSCAQILQKSMQIM